LECCRDINFDKLFKLRLTIARYGEMDVSKWWNTRGILGRYGTIAISRGFPGTHRFAQARIAFAVARSRCEEVFNPPGCMTLWNLPAPIEDQFETQWQNWLDDIEKWEPFFKNLETVGKADLLDTLQELDLLNVEDAATVKKCHRSAEGKAVSIPGAHAPDNEILALLAAGFSLGESGKLAVPYARLEE